MRRSLGPVVLACAVLTTLAPRAAPAEDAPAPAWLNARSPIAGTIGMDGQHLWWGIDGVLPLGVMPGLHAPLDRAPRLGLGLSVSGKTEAGASDLSYAALLDRRAPRTGEWLGFSTGRGGPAGASFVGGVGLWHSFEHIQIETGVISGMLPMREQQVEHWGYYRHFSDSLLWVDTTSFRGIL